MTRDCKHGRLARSCEFCDLELQVKELEAERDALKASKDEIDAAYDMAVTDLAAVAAERDALRQDAERYRFIRHPFIIHGQHKAVMHAVDELSEELMDSAIDEAMQMDKPKEQTK